MNPMHRRLKNWDYRSRCNYMITLVVEPRAPIFGKVEEWGVKRSEAARGVYDAWQAISGKFQEVQASYYVIMPDHFHGILYFKERVDFHLDEVVDWFKAETERVLVRRIWEDGYQDSVCIHAGQLHRMINYILDNPKRAWIKANNPDIFRKCWNLAHPRLPALGAESEKGGNWIGGMPDDGGREVRLPRRGNRPVEPFGTVSTRQKAGVQGFSQSAGQDFLSCAFCPIPGWSLIRPGLWRAGPGILPGGCAEAEVQTALAWAALGNIFLLDRPMLVALRLSRSTPPAELDRLAEKAAAYASRGAILISPFFSPPEQAIKQAAVEADGSVIQLVPNGFSSLAKPAGRDFGLCAEGRLLLLSAFPYEPGRGSLSKAKCEWMNSAARSIADIFLGWPRIAEHKGDER